MNCPFHILIFKSKGGPIASCRCGSSSSALSTATSVRGAARADAVRGFTQDDAHIFCTREQIVPELTSLLGFVLDVLRAFGLEEFEADISTRPDK